MPRAPRPSTEATSTLRVLSLVLGNDYRHPALLHKSLATLDVLSGGRVEIGLGAGWMPSDYAAAGIPFDPAGVRIDRLAEAIDVLKGLFGPRPLTYHGKHYQITGLDGLPKPVQAPHPPHVLQARERPRQAVCAEHVDVHVRWEAVAHVDLLGRYVKLVPARRQRSDKAVGDQPVSVRPVVG